MQIVSYSIFSSDSIYILMYVTVTSYADGSCNIRDKYVMMSKVHDNIVKICSAYTYVC